MNPKILIINLIFKTILLTCFISITTTLFCQETPNVFTEKISVKALHEDIDLLKTNLELVHPGLYCYTDKPTFDLFFQNLTQEINQPLSSFEFWRKLVALHGIIRNGHTNVVRSKSVLKAYTNHAKYLPFDSYLDNDTLYITRNFSADTSIQVGTAILKINNKPTNELFQQMMQAISSDGYNTTLPRNAINAAFEGWYARLIDLHPSNYNLQLLTPDGSIKEANIKSITAKQYNETEVERFGLPPKSFMQNDEPMVKLEFKEEVAILTIHGFINAKKNQKVKFKKFYKKAFEEIKAKNTSNLIIDIRNNAGGNPKPSLALLHHLIAEEFTLYEEASALVKKIPNKELYQEKGFWQWQFLNKLLTKKWGNKYQLKNTFFTRMIGMAGISSTKPASPVYKGNVYMLINGRSFSASGEVAAILKEHKRAVFIGEEMGGSPIQNASGIQLLMTLPNSGVRIGMPLWLWKTKVSFENTGHGIMPDHQVRNTFEEKIAGKDAVMEFTLALIKKGKQ